MDYEKDPVINFRSVVRGFSKKKDELNPAGREHFALYLDQEAAAILRDAIDANIENPRGVKLDLYVGKKETNEGNRVFDSAFAFIKAVQEKAAAPAPKAYVPKGTPSAATKARTQKVSKELGE